MPRLLHLADLHLGWTPRGVPTEVAREVRRGRDALLAEAVDVALAERVDLVVIAGDLFETYRPEPGVVAEALRQLGRLADAGIMTVTAPGNHDELSYARSVYRAESARWPGLLITRPDPGPVATVTVAGVEVHVAGLAYVAGVTPADAPLRSFPRAAGAGVHLGVFHGTLVGAGAAPGGPFGGARSLPIDAAALAAAGFDYVALGHLHTPHTLPLGPGRLAAYAGCVGGKGPGDPGVAAWTLVDLAPGQVRSWQRPARVAPVWSREVDVGAFDGPEGLIAHVASLGGAGTWGRVRLVGVLGFDLDEADLVARAGSAFRHLEVTEATARIDPALLADWARQPTVRGAFVRRMQSLWDAADDPAERAKVTRALRHGLRALADSA